MMMRIPEWTHGAIRQSGDAFGRGIFRLAVILGLAIGLCAPSTMADAQDQYFDILDQAVRNGAIVDGFGYSYWPSSHSQTDVYQVKSSKEAANGVNFITISFQEDFHRPPNFTLSFERCGNAVDTGTMFEYLRDRPLLVSHIDSAEAELSTGKVQLWDAFDIREISKSVTRWDDQVVRYDNSTKTGDYAPSAYSRFYIFVFSGWCLAGPAADSSGNRLDMMFAIRENTLRALGLQAGTGEANIPGASDSGSDSDTIHDDSTTDNAGYNGTDSDGGPYADNGWPPVGDGGYIPPSMVAAGAVAAGGIAGLGAWLTMGRMGVGRREAFDALGDLLRGRLPSDGFDEWKSRYEALGWTYREENGVAVFDPPEGWREQAAAPPPLPAHRDGDVNLDTGEVWSDEDGGWIGRNLYDQERARRKFIEEVKNRAATQDQDVKALHGAWLAKKRWLEDMPGRFAEVEQRKDAMKDRLDEMIREAKDETPERREFLQGLRERVGRIDFIDSGGELPGLRRALNAQLQQGFEQTYTMGDVVRDTAVHGGALVLDALVTRGMATSALYGVERTLDATAQGKSFGDALLDGANTGAKTMVTFWLAGKAMSAAGQAFADTCPGLATSIEKLANTEIRFKPGSAAETAGKTRIWGSNMSAVRDEVRERAVAKLPESIKQKSEALTNINRAGEINRTLREIGGDAYDPHLVSVHRRLTPGHTTYKAGTDALALDATWQRGLTQEARTMADAVRHDLNLRAIEGAAKRIYTERPDLAGALRRIENTGSHAMKGANYRPQSSDIDYTVVGDGTAAGDEAVALFDKMYADEVSRVTNGQLTAEQLKVHVYSAEGVGTGAFTSDAGLAMKDMMNATSGRIDVFDAQGNLSHSLRGGDVIEMGGKIPRFTPAEGMSESQAGEYLGAFRRDLVNKFTAERPEMGTPAEETIQAAKAYRLFRVGEAKLPGGRTIGTDRGLYDLAKTIKTDAPNMSTEELASARDWFLSGVRGE